MAFPTSPSNGQIYKKYKYNTTLSLWEVNVAQQGNTAANDFSNNPTTYYAPVNGEDSMGTPFSRVTNFQGLTIDSAWHALNISSACPPETTWVYVIMIIKGTGINQQCIVSDSTHEYYVNNYTQVSGAYLQTEGWVPVNNQTIYYFFNVNINYHSIKVMQYRI